MTDNDNTIQKQQIAGDIMEYVKRRLLLNLRYLSRAIYALPPSENEQISGIGTDGQFLLYETSYTIQCFQYDRNRLNRIYLHTLLHCIFRHFDVRPDIDRKLWNLSCDIAVENILQELHLPDMKIPEETGQFEFLSLLAGRLNLLSAEKIYHFFIEEVFTENSAAQKSDIDLPQTEQLFYGDDHSFWYQQTTGRQTKDLEKESINAKIFEDLDVTDPDELRIIPKVELTDEWKKIADIIKIDLETESTNKGVHAGSLNWQLQVTGRDRVDYRDFLRSTFSILKSQETFHHKMNIYLIQCDAQIQQVTVIESDLQLQSYLNDLTVYGYGGTDFRPVFAYIAQLQEQGQLHRLEGLLYFTDGLGIYPTRPVPYKTAFVFTEPELELQKDFPGWAMKLILTEDEIDTL